MIHRSKIRDWKCSCSTLISWFLCQLGLTTCLQKARRKQKDSSQLTFTIDILIAKTVSTSCKFRIQGSIKSFIFILLWLYKENACSHHYAGMAYAINDYVCQGHSSRTLGFGTYCDQEIVMWHKDNFVFFKWYVAYSITDMCIMPTKVNIWLCTVDRWQALFDYVE